MKQKEILESLEQIKALLAAQTASLNTVLWLLVEGPDDGDEEDGPPSKIFTEQEERLLINLQEGAN